MRHRLALVFLAVLFVLGFVSVARAQSRVDTFDATTFVQPSTVDLSQLDDAGWSARWCGSLPSTDGGTAINGCTGWYELKTVGNRNKADGLAQAGANRWLRSFAFNVDAGSF